MKNETRVLFNQYLADQANLNGVPNANVKFNVAPSVQQRLESRIQESSGFLKLINIVPVDEKQGEKLGLGTDGPVASRTDTTKNDRTTRDASSIDKHGYSCEQTNYDTHLRYAKLDMWAKFKDFQLRIARAVQQQCALDRIMIGFNGQQALPETNRATAPLLQDVNKGWLQQLREQAAGRVLAGGKTAGKVVVGGAAPDYKSLDGLVLDAYKSLLDPWHAGAGDLVAIVGRGLMHDKLFPLVDGQKAPTEMLAASIVVSQMRLGELQALSVPFFPENKVLITSLDNLSIYYQEGARRRSVIDNPKRDQIETYESSNDAFVVEDFGKACLVENIEIVAA